MDRHAEIVEQSDVFATVMGALIMAVLAAPFILAVLFVEVLVP